MKELGGLDGAQDAGGASLASGQKPPHLVKEVRMNKGKRGTEAVGGGPHIWPEAHIWKALGRRGHIWAEGHSRRGTSEGG